MMPKTFNSPNFSKNTRNVKKIKFIIIHYTGMQSERVSLNQLKDLKSKVSCHYFITRQGEILRMVELPKKTKIKVSSLKDLSKIMFYSNNPYILNY